MTNQTAAPRLRRRRAALALAGLAAGSLAFTATAGATTYNPANGAELVTAVNNANTNPGHDTIVLNAANYLPTSPLTVADDLTITSNPAHQAPPTPRLDGAFVNPLQSDLLTINAGVSLRFKNTLVTSSSDLGFTVFRVAGVLDVENAAISGNNGAGVIVESGGTATFANSTLDNGNSLAGIVLGTLNLRNSTVTLNTGGFDNSNGVLNVYNTILAKNDQQGTGMPNCGAPVNDTVASLDDLGDCGVAFTADPNLAEITTQGGPTPSIRPNAGSPVINAGSSAQCPTTDQRYFVRSDGQCDIGAFEVDAVRDTTAPTCTVSALRNGPPKQQDVTAQDGGSGLDRDAITDVAITNGTVAFTPFTSASRAGLVLTATKTDQAQLTRWSFTATDAAGNVKDCR